MPQQASAQTDAELLSRYTRDRDADSFNQLVARHGSMVYATALRVTASPEDAHDVTQSCFLQLARGAAAIHTSVPGWLHAIAVRRGIDLSRHQSLRRKHEAVAARARSESSRVEPDWNQLLPLVDEALASLDQSLRVPLVLYYLEGKSQIEIAAELGLNQSSVSRRLQTGIDTLRTNLKTLGLVVSAGLLVTAMTQSANAALPAALKVSLGKMALAGISAHAASPMASFPVWLVARWTLLVGLGGGGIAAVPWRDLPLAIVLHEDNPSRMDETEVVEDKVKLELKIGRRSKN